MYDEHWGLLTAPFQNVPDPKFFFLSTQHREGLARLTRILMAQPEIAEMIGRSKLLDQRIAIRHRLKPLNQAETTRDMAFRLQKAGCTRRLFAEEALQLVWQHTHGVPPSINTLRDLCLLDGYRNGVQLVDAALVTRVAGAMR